MKTSSYLLWASIMGWLAAWPISTTAQGQFRTVDAFGDVTFTDPVAIRTPPAETNSLYVVEQRGVISVITNLAAPTRTVFMDISSRVSVLSGASDERGCLGLAFHPGYKTNHFFYVFYTTSGTLFDRLSRFQSSLDFSQGLPNSEVTLINQFDNQSNHNGGDLHFGPDRYLYVSLGDEGGANDSENNSQRITNDFFSAILRIDVDKRPGNLPANTHPAASTNYAIPADNPFVGATNFNNIAINPLHVRTEFWAVGLRNPWRMAFDSVTGRLYCGDVGQGAWEEVDIITRGGNYGWAFREGDHPGPHSPPSGLNLIPPIYEYSHGNGTNQGFSVTGGVVYRGNQIPSLVGRYVFADYVSDNIWSFLYEGGSTVSEFRRLTTNPDVAAFGVDPRNGDILMADRSDDAIKRLIQEGSAQLIRGPYLQMATPNSAIVRWRTDLPTDSRVRYGADSANLALMVTDATPTNEHVVLVTNLFPETKYFYSVGSSSTVLAGSTSHFFVTAPPTGQVRPVRLWAIGDSGTANANAQAVRNAYLNYADTGPIDVWLMLGDNAYNSGLDNEYQAAVFNIYPTLLRNTFLWPTIGNHDTAQSPSANSFPYLDIFTLPRAGEAGGVPSGTEKYYSFDYANIHFICLDSMSSSRLIGSPMLTWLRSDLEATTQTWLIAYWHHPPYTKGSHDSDVETELIQMRENALPLLEEFDIDLVLVGHSHSFERSFLLNGHYGSSSTLTPAMKIDPGDGREEGTGPYVKRSSEPTNNGAVYVVAGSSGQISGGLLNHPGMYISLNVLGSMVIDVSSNRLDAVFLGTGATALDHFTIIKDQPPSIQTQPVNVTVTEPNAATFSVVANGTAPLTYQWRRGGANMAGATNSSYTLNPTSRTNDNGAQFEVIVSNSSGAVTSTVAALTVNAPAAVPANGLALWLRADAGTAGPTLTQWNDQSGNNRHATQNTSASQPLLVNSALNGLPVVRFDGVNDFLTFNLPVNGLTGLTIFLVAANTQNQTAGPTQGESAALFWNETAGWGTVYLTPFQSSVRLRFGTTQAGNQIGYNRPGSVGSSFSLSTAIKNGTTDTLYINGAQVLSQGGKLGTIAGCQNTGNLARGYNNDTFYAGDIAEVLVYTRALTGAERQTVEHYLDGKYALTAPPPPQPPSIQTQPANVVVTEPNPANFSVVANGTVPLTYQWRRGGANLSGATSSSYTLNPTSRASDNGAQFDVIVSNSSGAVTSTVATLTVNAPGTVPANGLALWLRADAGTAGSTLTQWNDQSGNNRHATQSTSASQPLLVNSALNGLPVVRFDGINDFLTFTLPVNGLTGLTIFLVAANTQNQTAGPTQGESAALFWNETAGWGTVYLTPFQSSVRLRFGTTQAGNQIGYNRPGSLGSSFSLSTAIKNGTTDTLYINGAQVLSQGGKLGTIAGCQNTGNLARGYNNDTFYAGDIAEVLVYTRALTGAERQTVEQYLDGKYALTAPPPPQPPSIQTQPANVVVTEPNPANFSVVANGTAPLTYQWRRGGATISGADSSSYTLNPTSRASDNGAQFDVIVSNSSGAVTSTVATLTVNAPGTVPANGLALWLRADAGTAGPTLTQWSDQSGNNRHATQNTSASQPLLVNSALNGLPVVRFDGVNDFLTFTLPVNGLTGMTIFLVAANTQNQTAGPTQGERAALFWNETAGWGTVYLTPFQSSVRMRFGTTQAGNQMAYNRPSSLGSSFSLSTAIKNGTTDTLYINGAQVLSQGGKLGTIAGCLNTGNLGRGYNNDTFYAGDMAEVLVYTQALTASERQTVEQYLSNKYQVPGPAAQSIQASALGAAQDLLLTIEYQTNELLISWPLSCLDCILQQAPNLEEPVAWTGVPGLVQRRNNRHCVILPVGGSNTFYRLREP